MKTISEHMLALFERNANQSYRTLLNAKEMFEKCQKQADYDLARYEKLAAKMGLVNSAGFFKEEA